jgi:hypothetical protein
MRKLVTAAIALLAVCAAVAAAEKLSEAAKKKVAAVETDLRRRMRDDPPSFHELCIAEYRRLQYDREDKQADPLRSLRTLKRGLEWKIRELNPFWKSEEEVEKPLEEPPKRIYKQYDIADIVSLAPDRYAPTIGFGMGHFLHGSTTRSVIGGLIDLGDSDYSGAGFDWEKICELISRKLGDDFEGEYRYSGGKLTCYLSAENLKVIEDLLTRMRKCTGYSINLEVRFIRAKEDYIEQLGQKEKGSVIYLSAEAEKKLLSDAAAKKDVEIVASSEVMASDGQVVHIREGRQVSLLMDYDFSSVDSNALQPLVRVVNEGLICQFKPKVILDGKKLNIQVLASLSSLNKDMRKKEFMGGELVLPSMQLSRIHTTVQVPSGTAALVGGTATTSGAKGDEQSFIVFVKPTLVQK